MSASAQPIANENNSCQTILAEARELVVSVGSPQALLCVRSPLQHVCRTFHCKIQLQTA